MRYSSVFLLDKVKHGDFWHFPRPGCGFVWSLRDLMNLSLSGSLHHISHAVNVDNLGREHHTASLPNPLSVLSHCDRLPRLLVLQVPVVVHLNPVLHWHMSHLALLSLGVLYQRAVTGSRLLTDNSSIQYNKYMMMIYNFWYKWNSHLPVRFVMELAKLSLDSLQLVLTMDIMETVLSLSFLEYILSTGALYWYSTAHLTELPNSFL